MRFGPPELRGTDFQITKTFGEEGQAIVAGLMDMDIHDLVEVKRSSYADASLYVEQTHLPRYAAEYEDSGITTTKSRWWAFLKPGDLMLMIPTDHLRYVVSIPNIGVEKETEPNEDNDNPTKGLLVPVNAVYALYDRQRRHGLP